MTTSFVLLIAIGAIMVTALAAAMLAMNEAEKLAPGDAVVGLSTATGIVVGGVVGMSAWVATDRIGWTLLAFVGMAGGFLVGRIRAESSG